jgi:tetratricopeptide (TPR) repeat protein
MTMLWFVNKKHGGYIKALKLTKFWNTLTLEEKESCKEYFSKNFYPEPFNKESVDNSNFKVSTEITRTEFLTSIANRSTNQKNFSLAEKLLLKASELEKNALKKHEILTNLIDVYYKQRTEREDALAKCKYYCEKDINLAPKILSHNKEIHSFKRLAIILETEEQYKAAIALSEKALKYGLTDGTKGGYEGRIQKLKTKISS